ncbi:hypothetical protein GPALN_005182 [Globodera pallida]|nr:hypothetical protein GPALN_005182 [Globodera pallida]
MSGHKLHRSSSSSSMVAWSSHSPLSRTYSVSDISTYANASDYFKKRWSTAYNPYHYSRKAYHWPHHRHTALFPLYSLHENTRYYYESPFYTRAPTCSPAWDYSSNSNYYTYLLDSVRPVWRCWPYPQKSSYYEYRTYWPWRESIRSHFWHR